MKRIVVLIGVSYLLEEVFIPRGSRYWAKFGVGKVWSPGQGVSGVYAPRAVCNGESWGERLEELYPTRLSTRKDWLGLEVFQGVVVSVHGHCVPLEVASPNLETMDDS